MIDWLKRYSLFIVIGIFIIGFLFITRDKNDIEHHLTPVTASNEKGENFEEDVNHADEEILVDIKGEVKKPGVYELSLNDRVQDVVERASGFTDKADETAINLAQKIHDEMIIVVPQENEEAVVGMEDVSTAGETKDKVRLNYATQEEIESLSGIGPSKAQSIIEYREEHGLFKSADDLLDISGIGEKTLENFRDDIQIP